MTPQHSRISLKPCRRLFNRHAFTTTSSIHTHSPPEGENALPFGKVRPVHSLHIRPSVAVGAVPSLPFPCPFIPSV
uniref:Uncharacterized protein n=1 Tax=Globodera rostochiensis TaxID=31243 RepID=A0A914I562_GLORO